MVSLVTSVTSMLVSILTHIRYSKCGFCEIETREDTDENKNRSRSNSNHSHNEQQPLIQPLN
jgi:hypothetical protein